GVGLYGTVSCSVAQQVGEIGIRMALGAQRGAVVWMVLRRVLLLAAVGLAISVPAALSASQLVKSFLFETQPNDPGTLALAGVVLLSAVILAGYAPARRASRIDPLAALRHEEDMGLRTTKDENVLRRIHLAYDPLLTRVPVK